MKNWIKVIIVAVLAVALAALIAVATAQKKHLNSLKEQVTEQGVVIDSLLNRRMSVLDVKLNVTDKSRNIIYGKHNTGYIYQPQERRYILEVDSVNVSLR